MLSPWGPHQSQETIQNTPDEAFCLSWFPKGKSMMPQPLLMLTTTPPHKSISPIPKDPESHIGCPWGSLGFHQSQKLTKTTQFYVAVFRMAKIMLWPPKCLYVYIHQIHPKGPWILHLGAYRPHYKHTGENVTQTWYPEFLGMSKKDLWEGENLSCSSMILVMLYNAR